MTINENTSEPCAVHFSHLLCLVVDCPPNVCTLSLLSTSCPYISSLYKAYSKPDTHPLPPKGRADPPHSNQHTSPLYDTMLCPPIQERLHTHKISRRISCKWKLCYELTPFLILINLHILSILNTLCSLPPFFTLLPFKQWGKHLQVKHVKF